MKKALALTLLIAGLVLGGSKLLTFADNPVCCGNPDADCCPLKK